MMKHRNLPDWIARGLCLTVAVAFASLWVGPSPASAQEWPSGETILSSGAAETAINGEDGSLVYQMLPAKSASSANSHGTPSPFYFVFYPLSSDVPASSLNCQPTNCDHLNVLPFENDDYGAAGSTACNDFNGGQSCSVVIGHDHLRGSAPPAGGPTTSWNAWFVWFTTKGFGDGAINHRITTVNQLESLYSNGDVDMFAPGLTLHLNRISKKLYESGTAYETTYP